MTRPKSRLAGSLAFAMIWIGYGSLATQVLAQDDGGSELLDAGPNRADEPLAKEFSISRAIEFLDITSTEWQDQRNCMTCHTNYAYLYARPAVPIDSEAHQKVRNYAERLVTDRWQKVGPRWDAEVVATAAALAFHDDATTGRLHDTTRTALDRMWTVQRDDGGWDWLKCGWPPMESDDHYGVTLAAIATGVAPGDYARSEQAQQGIKALRRYLDDNPTPTLHHKAMLLWANSYFDDLVSAQRKEEWTKELLRLQRPDGGWTVASLGNWERADGKQQDVETSDGYGTGFVIYVLRRSGVEADHPSIVSGVEWLKANQRESGRWFTRSLNRDGRHFLSHAGSAMAIMALAECGVDEQVNEP